MRPSFLGGSFNAFCKAARRRGLEPVVSESARTMILEVADISFLEPFVGTHRVQRIPKGEQRRHTSTCTVAIVDQVDNDDFIPDEEIEERFDRGSGKGGQHQNTTDSAVTLVHLPTGISVHIEGRKQWGNRQEARRVLSDRVAAHRLAEGLRMCNDQRRVQINPERSAKSFTHNTQRNEVVNHETGQSWRLGEFQKGKF